MESRQYLYDSITNEYRILDLEISTEKDSIQYYLDREKIFYDRITEKTDSTNQIDAKKLVMLQEIKAIFDKHHTNYKIVLSPLYEQIKYSAHDINLLKQMFGDRLFDFTGKNNFTDFKKNYYETSHYKPIVGDSIFKIIYKQNTKWTQVVRKI